MPRLAILTHDGARFDLDPPAGTSVMEAARDAGVPGIDADCGGMCACATCHVFVAPEWHARTGARSEMEDDLLQMAETLRETSRLACQIRMDDALDGLLVEVPAAQH